MSLWHRFDTLPAFRLLRESARKPGEVVLEGLTGAARHTLLRALREKDNGPGLILTSTAAEAQRWAEDWQSLDPEKPLLLFPEREVLPFEVVTQSPETTRRRLAVLRSLMRDPSSWVVAPVGALLTALTPARIFREAEVSLRSGLPVSLPSFRQQILLLGYTVEDRVNAVGQAAFRGGIVDLWDPVMDHPLRIEWFDDEIDSLRLFSAEDQRSIRTLEEAAIGPATEGIVPPTRANAGLAVLRSGLRERVWQLCRTGQKEVADRIRERIEGVLARFGESPSGSEVDGFLSSFYRPTGTLLDYFTAPPLLVLEEPQRLFETVRAAERGAQERLTALVMEGVALEGQGAIHLGERALRQRLASLPTLSLQGLIRQGERTGSTVIQVQTGGAQVFHGRWPLFLGEVQKRLAEGETVLLFAGSPEGQKRLADALRAEDLLPLERTADTASEEGGLLVLPVPLSAGFSLPDLRLFAVTEQEVFGQRRRTRAREVREEGKRTMALSDLAVGDYVVHESHGVGRYLGLKSMEIGGVQKDYLHIAYQGEDVLYVPTDQLHLVQKYVGQEGFTPRLSKLGGADWQRVKNRVKASVQEMAKELLELYAARESQVGHAFGPDTPWQAELEERFPYEETRDQAVAIAEIKADMEKLRTMDRLLCGDVGYGKTEVALRAAFKAVMDGKQVAVLVPTTILAQQHTQTFRKRYEGFPVVVEQLSRFRTPREQTQVIRRLKAGEVDVVIGTHRLLGKDVQFKDLGLLIIDEEQRFGVAHKERLKALRRDVDCLTMTATPIPRTLHMGLVGMRDMSVIETPPEGRFPVQTYVVEHSDELVADAVRREVARDGQVFYVHNRVQGIERIYRHLQEVLPDVRITLAHGQMDERLLERNMQAFLEGEFDLLLSTTIIESGLDMPRVNTLIVEDADRFGLSQLYQLRGRIGRSQRLAFAHFTYRPDKVLSEEAEKRLSAIREFTQFGAGFKIAMRDLQIRGAGNILGPEQHGHIAAVGFDLYTRLLEEAVGELRGRPTEVREYPTIELDVDAYLPDTYIADAAEKIEIYKRIAGITRPEEAADLTLELEDRFGPPPRPVANLLSISRLRIGGEAVGIAQVGRERDRVLLKFRHMRAFPAERLADLARHFRGRVSFQATPFPHLALRVSGDPLPMVEEVLGFLTAQAQTA